MATASDPDEARRPDGTFATRYDASGLYPLVAGIARAVDAEYPDRITMRAFDDARASAGHPDAPSARAICMRLKISWPELLATIFDENRNLTMTGGARDRAAFRIPTEEEIFFALRFIETKCGTGAAATYNHYERHREELIARDRGRTDGRSFLESVLPKASQIWNAAGKDWQFALQIAHLPPSKPATHTRAYTLDEIYDAFVRTTGCRPQGWRTVDRFAQKANVPMERKHHRQSFKAVEKQIVARRRKAGLETPATVMNMKTAKHLEIPQGIFGDENGRLQRREAWTYETALTKLAEYVRSLPAGAKASQRDYQARRKNTDWPAVRKIQDYAPWAKMLSAARVLAQTGEIIPLEELKSPLRG